jgi:hypothetical protein
VLDVKQPGSQSVVLVGGDRNAGTIVAISTWDTEEHARFSRDDALSDIQRRVLATGTELDPPQIYEAFR